jgi:hypothetical protein
MKTIEVKVYKYSELNDAAKAKAREWFRGVAQHDDFWSECVIDDAKSIAKIMGIEICDVYFSGFSSQGDGACFTGEYRNAENCAEKVKGYAPQDKELYRIAYGLQALQIANSSGLWADIKHRGRYSHSGCMEIGIEQTAVNASGNYLELSEDVEKDLSKLFRDFADWIYRQLEKEYDYQNSDAELAEGIVSNEYDFLSSGARFNNVVTA